MPRGLTTAEIDVLPLLPWPVLALLGLAAVLLCGFALWRRVPGALARLGLLALGLAALVNPVLVRQEREPLADVALLLVDESPSQTVGNRPRQVAAASDELKTRLAAEPGLELRVVSAAKGGEAIDSDAGTRLMPAMARALADVPRDRLAGVILLTDGEVHDSVGEIQRADPGAPVHVLLSGERRERDRRLVVEQVPRYGIVGEQLSFALKVDDQGDRPERSARVTLRHEDGRSVTQTVRVGAPHVLPFSLQHGGQTVFEAEVEGLPGGELTTRNNRVTFAVNGVRDRLRVLLVSGEPHPGERTWRNILKADPAVDLVHFTILRPPEKQDGTPIRELSLISFPTRELFEVKLDEFDLIIFDRYRRRGILPDAYLRNVAEYVEKGGAVLIGAGPDYATPLSLHRSPLSSILPTEPSGEIATGGFRPRLSKVGRRHPVTADLPGGGGTEPAWGRWFRLILADARRGETLLTDVDNRPVLIVDRVGKGRVAQLLSDHIWLWARGFEGGGPQAELLRRLAHWSMQEPDLEEEDLRAHADGQRLSVSRRTLAESAEPVQITLPSGEVHTLALEARGDGQFRAALNVEAPGLYRLRDGARSAVVAVGALNPREYADLRATAHYLRPLAQASGGEVFWLQDGVPAIRRVLPGRDAAGRQWLGLRANQAFVVRGVETTALLPALVVLSGLLALAMLAWYREGR